MKKVVVINGSGTSGKDEVGKIAGEILEDKTNMKVSIISSIDAVKDRAKLFGWNSEKDDKSRRFLSDIKDAWTMFNNGPMNDVIDKIRCMEALHEILGNANVDTDYLIFVHIREPEEIAKIVSHDKLGKVETLLVRRPGVEQFDNHADQEVEEYPYDYIIENDGTLDDLKEHVRLFLEDIKIL